MQCVDISISKQSVINVLYPTVDWRGWDKIHCQVLPLMVTMVGIGFALAAQGASGGVDEQRVKRRDGQASLGR